MAREPSRRVVGLLTSTVFRIPAGVRSWVDNVAIDVEWRRHGIARALNQAGIRISKARGARTVDLTSRVSRAAANVEDKRSLRTNVGVVAAQNAQRVGLYRNARVLIYGYSYIFPIVLPALPDDIKESLQIVAPRFHRRNINEGERVRDELEKDPLLHVTVLDDHEAIERLRAGEFDTFVMSAKAIGQHLGALSVINTYSREDFPGTARAVGCTVLVVSGRYKIWPEELFCDRAAKVLLDREPADAVVPEAVISWLMTEIDAFTPCAAG